MPAGVVVNRQREVLQFRGRTGPFLEHPQGEATLDLIKMAREGLTAALRSAFARAVKQNARVREESVTARQNGGLALVNIEVVPFQVPPSRERFYLVLFEQARPPASIGAAPPRSAPPSSTPPPSARPRRRSARARRGCARPCR
ncbi:MAG: hypothetical protein FJ291_32675 [Planctomycetes bacterium]|nr:hypothetical protein [Planctomycetota bacterium]